MPDRPDRPTRTGPAGYENWRAAIAGARSGGAIEVNLYSDARILGQLDPDSPNPYSFLHALAFGREGELFHVITLRAELHGESARPDMTATDTSRYHGGWLPDEIAALASLLMGKRIRPGSVTRDFNRENVRGRPQADTGPPQLVPRRRTGVWLVPRAQGVGRLDEPFSELFCTYPNLSPKEAVALVRAARLYQDAVWVAETEPQLSWLFLVSALEVLATLHQVETTSAAELLRRSNKPLTDLLAERGGEQLVEDAAKHLHQFVRATGRFIDFTLEFLPPEPADRPAQCFKIDWSRKAMKRALSKIYGYRSLALHNGTPFPAPMSDAPILGPLHFEAPGASAAASNDATWVREDMPMLLHTFEYIARGAILNWWRKAAERSAASRSGHAGGPCRLSRQLRVRRRRFLTQHRKRALRRG